MASRRKNRLLVPEAREALDNLMGSDSDAGKNKQGPSGHSNTGKIVTIGPNGILKWSDETPKSSPASRAAEEMQVPYKENGDNGNLTTRQAGKIGGKIGGPMVRKLVQIAEQHMAEKQSQENASSRH